jgi:D-psicose/D-tagatose/L-ribulose 3-epimerase
MKLAISNIAWPNEDDAMVASVMSTYDITGIEIAPTKVWPDPTEVHELVIDEYRQRWEDRGITVVAMQALLYGQPELTIFGDEATRQRTLDYLIKIMRVGRHLGARALVFGSPKNRKVGALEKIKAHDIAVDLFRRAGSAAQDHGVVLCIEANPVEYQCDFVNTTPEAVALVKAVDNPGFGLHLDTAGITMSEETADSLGEAIQLAHHFHASEPYLAPVGESGVDHDAMAGALRKEGYANWVSGEMRQREDVPIATEMPRALRYLRDTYGS